MAIKNSSNIAIHKRVLAVFLTALMVATVFGIMGTSASTPHGVANDGYTKSTVVAPSKSTSIATSVPHAGRSGMEAHRDSKFQYNLITFVNCAFFVRCRCQSNDTAYYANAPAQLHRWNAISSQWEKIRDGTTNADGYVAFQGVKESKPGIYDYVITCQGQYINPLKILVTYPVIFVHGWGGSSTEMLRLYPWPWTNIAQALDNAGFVKGTHYFVFNYDSKDDPRIDADGLQKFIKEKKVFFHDQYQYDNSKFTIVCHSMGALVTRWYMEQEGGAENVVSSPAPRLITNARGCSAICDRILSSNCFASAAIKRF